MRFMRREVGWKRCAVRVCALAVGVCAVSVCAASAVAAAADETAQTGEIIRSAASGRVWQVNLAPDEPIRWPWATGADAARLTVSNACTQKVSEHVVLRTGDEAFGAFALSVAAKPAEQLCDLALEQFYRYGQSDEKAISAEQARVVYLPGVHGHGVTVPSARNLRTSEPVAVFAYDRAWASGSYTAATASVSWSSDGASGSRALDGTSGFDALPLERLQKTSLALAFDATTRWTCLVRFGIPGTLLLFR